MRSFPIIILAVVLLSVTSAYAIRETVFTDDGYIIVYPDNPDMAADYKVNYAIMNPEEFSKSKILIYDYDIEFVQRALKVAQEACAQSGKPNCADDVKGYHDTIALLVEMKSQQTGSPSKDAPIISPVGGEKTKSGAFDQLSKLGKKISELLGDTLEEIREAWMKLW